MLTEKAQLVSPLPEKVDTIVSVVSQSDDGHEQHNPALQVTADHRIEMVDAPIAELTKETVLLHVKATGVCG